MDTIHESWLPLLNKYTIKLDILYKKNIVFPPKECVFRVFSMPVDEIEIVLLGQDPYHNENQANGLSFSVNNHIAIPPSLNNIYKELILEYPERSYYFKHGNLERWFNEEHIFLLNASLTVIKNKPGSHMDIWKEFTDDTIKFISKKNKKCVFMLLGKFAQSKSNLIKSNNIVKAPHPSPLSHGFIGSDVFKKTEEKLGKMINWKI
jgi:uracil-DNA glycosylase